MPVHVALAHQIRQELVSVVLASAGTVFTGAIADTVGWTAAFGLLGGLLACTLAMLLTNRALSLDL